MAPVTLTMRLSLTVWLLVESEALEVIDLAAGAHVAHHDVTAVAAAVALVVVHHRRPPRRPVLCRWRCRISADPKAPKWWNCWSLWEMWSSWNRA